MISNREENNPKILVVEDEIESRKYLQLILSKEYELDFCDTKDSMLNLLIEKKYNAIIMDVTLKNGYNGIALIQLIKRKSAYKNIPIICLSAHAYGEERLKAEVAGADVYLTKPVANKVLLSTLEKFIAKSTGEDKKA